jgi:hypothetical protein
MVQVDSLSFQLYPSEVPPVPAAIGRVHVMGRPVAGDHSLMEEGDDCVLRSIPARGRTTLTQLVAASGKSRSWVRTALERPEAAKLVYSYYDDGSVFYERE